jgi:hypothetical protein
VDKRHQRRRGREGGAVSFQGNIRWEGKEGGGRRGSEKKPG